MRLKSNRGQVAQHDLLADVVDQGSNLLWALHNERRSGLRQCSQIVFICYSFGSFVVKEVSLSICFRSMLVTVLRPSS